MTRFASRLAGATGTSCGLLVVTGGVAAAAGLVFLSVLCVFGLSLVAWVPVGWFVGWLTPPFMKLVAKNLDGVQEMAGDVFDRCIFY
jgi:hypothetical protein